ncbi:MBL fold metallo-hydrolase [Acidobacteriota bacterium]
MDCKKAFVLILIIGIFGSCSTGPQDLPFRISKISDRVIIFSPGEHADPAPTTVITTDKGLILIDTGLTPTLAEMTKRRIRKELGRADFHMIINTHAHFDHSDGNQVYPDTQIYGHENAPAAIQRFYDGRESFSQQRRGRIARMEGQLVGMDPESNEALALKQSIQMDEIFLEDLQAIFFPTPPTNTFDDRMEIRIDDINILLLAFGRAHTDSDILVHIPALDVLFVGDLFHEEWLSVTAGPPPLDVPRWLEVLDTVLQDQDDIRTIIGGHGAIHKPEWLAAQTRYTRDLWTVVLEGQEAGQTLSEVFEQYPLQPQFNYLSPYFDLSVERNQNRHREVLQSFWRSNLQSAANEIERVVRENGLETAITRFEQVQKNLGHEFYVDEAEFNRLGYSLLQERKIDEALAIFKMNTEAFPESWNVWDSLGEAYMWSGDNENSEKNYLRSVEINPDNENGLRNLSRYQGYRMDTERETRETRQYEPGVQTGLRGPYLGQTPPGLEPQVFAPGIVSIHESMDFSITFSPDGKEIYFTQRAENGGQNTIYVCRLEPEGWTAPKEAEFTEGFPSNEPFITPDGQKLYYGTNRIQPGGENPEYGVWKTERVEDGWGSAQYHGPGMYVSSDNIGTLYMTDISGVAGGGLIRYPFEDGKYGVPEGLPDSINAPTPVAHGFISPDGNYLIFDASNRPDAQGGEGDFYISFLQPDGTWGNAINLGEPVNSPATHLCPSLSPDGKYLFYSSCRDIYWVSIEVLDKLK